MYLCNRSMRRRFCSAVRTGAWGGGGWYVEPCWQTLGWDIIIYRNRDIKIAGKAGLSPVGPADQLPFNFSITSSDRTALASRTARASPLPPHCESRRTSWAITMMNKFCDGPGVAVRIG